MLVPKPGTELLAQLLASVGSDELVPFQVYHAFALSPKPRLSAIAARIGIIGQERGRIDFINIIQGNGGLGQLDQESLNQPRWPILRSGIGHRNAPKF